MGGHSRWNPLPRDSIRTEAMVQYVQGYIMALEGVLESIEKSRPVTPEPVDSEPAEYPAPCARAHRIGRIFTSRAIAEDVHIMLEDARKTLDSLIKLQGTIERSGQ